MPKYECEDKRSRRKKWWSNLTYFFFQVQINAIGSNWRAAYNNQWTVAGVFCQIFWGVETLTMDRESKSPYRIYAKGGDGGDVMRVWIKWQIEERDRYE